MTATAEIKKVGGGAKVTPVTAAEAPPVTAGAAPAEIVKPKTGGLQPRAVLDFRTAVSGTVPCFVERDGKVLLTALPTNYDYSKHRALEKDSFTPEAEACFYDYKGNATQKLADTYARAAEGYKAQAAAFRQFGNPEQRKLATKAQSMLGEYAAMLEQMKAEGMDISKLPALTATVKA